MILLEFATVLTESIYTVPGQLLSQLRAGDESGVFYFPLPILAV
jgi:hypothetical protein